MRLFRWYLLALILCVPALFFLHARPAPNIKIMTSIFPFYEFAREISGDRGDVELLVPPGAEIHSWKPKPSDILKLAEADLFIGVGPSLEPWLDDILQSANNPGLRRIDAVQLLGLAQEEHETHSESHQHEGVDPHVWLDFRHDQKIVSKIGEILSLMDADSSDYYMKRTQDCLQKLAELDRKYIRELNTCGTKTFILGGHSAFGYLARKYGLNQIAVYGLNPDSQPSPRKLAEVIRTAREQRVHAIFYEIALSDDIATMVAEEVGVQVLPLNPGASISRKDLQSGVSFFDIMERNLENLKIGMSCW